MSINSGASVSFMSKSSFRALVLAASVRLARDFPGSVPSSQQGGTCGPVVLSDRSNNPRQSAPASAASTHKATASCIQGLPDEILSMIFVYCLPAYPIVESSSNIAPLLLCCVSKRFNGVAIATPTLWSSPSIFFNFRKPHDVKQARVLGNFLARAQAVPLTIHLSTNPSDSRLSKYRTEASNEIIRNCLHQIISCQDRWKNISIHLPGRVLGSFFQATITAPQLETFNMNVYTARPGDDAVTPVYDFIRCERLSEVSLHSPVSLSDLRLPWSKLKSLALTVDQRRYTPGLTTSDVIEILKKSSNLRSCKVDACNTSLQRGQAASLGEKVSHSALERLDLGVTLHGDQEVLTTLTLPNLTRLAIRIMRRWAVPQAPGPMPSPPTWSWTEFVQRSQCPIKALSVVHTGNYVRAFSSLLVAVPDLELLKCSGGFLHRQTIHSLQVSEDHLLVLPHLRGIYSEGPREHQLQGAYESLLQRRAWTELDSEVWSAYWDAPFL